MASEIAQDKAPLAGVVMCCTSIEPERRHLIATAAEEMGATHKFDLTSDVTHLIVGDVDTPKYKYVAKERPDVKAVVPEFVDAVRQVWIEGGDVELAALETEYKAPALMGLKICLTGFESTSTRDSIRGAIAKAGGEFHGDLTKAVTHLIAAVPAGKKYEHARRWGIKVVAIEWLHDSITRGMTLEEELYDPTLAPQDRGIGAYNKVAMEKVSLGKRQREPEEKVPEPPARRKLRRTMSKKMEVQQETIWADIAAGSGQQKTQTQDAELPEVDSLLGVLPRPKSRPSAETTPDATVEPTRRRPSDEAHAQSTKGQEFKDCIIYLHDFTRQWGFPSEKQKKMQTLLEERGARVYTSEARLEAEVGEDEEGYVIVPVKAPIEKLSSIPAMATTYKRVTEWWIESCIGHRQRIPHDFPLCQPFANQKVEGLEGMTIASSGFLDYDLIHVSGAVRMIAAMYHEGIKAGVDVIIFNSHVLVNKEKLEFAAENNIPAVGEQWLLDSIEFGVKQDFKIYLVKTETPTVPLDYEPPKTKATGFRQGAKSRPRQLEMQAPTQVPQKSNTKVLQNDRPTKVSKARPKQAGPFYEDDDDMPVMQQHDGPVSSRDTNKRPPSQPLGELSQGQQNSQGRSQSFHSAKRSPSLPQNENFDSSKAAANLVDTTKEAALDTSQAAQPTATQLEREERKVQLNDTIAQLLAAKQNRRTVSAESAAPLDPLRKKRTLGRAPSGGSFGSVNREYSVDSTEDSAYRRDSRDPPPDPSQKIIYEDAEGREARRALIKKMGGRVDEDEGRGRVEGVGVVKDIKATGAGEGGMGRRVRKR